MKFLLDEHLPIGLVAVIVGLGHEAWHVKSEGWTSAGDGEIWRLAGRMQATVVSKDSDFLSLALRDGRPAGLLHLNLGNISNRTLYEILRQAWPRLIASLTGGDTIVEVRP